MNILVLSAYDADSHQRWHQGLVKYLPYNITVMALPPRYFSWRVRGNPLTWAFGHYAELTAKKWDVIFATSMVDIATLKGLVPALAVVPTLVYFHENQFAYPVTTHSYKSVEPKMVSLYAALAANHIVFNSAYNKNTFLQGVSELLKKMPDAVPAGVTELLANKASVIPVPLENSCFELAKHKLTDTSHSLTIVWNHRWEYDKDPELLLAIVQQLLQIVPHANMKWHVVGQQFRQIPSVFEELKALLIANNWLGEWGFLPLSSYQQVLQQSHLVLSTALHEFQGLAVMEAVAAGCIPVLPKRVAYPDFFAADYLYDVTGDLNQQAKSASQKILKIVQAKQLLSAPDMSAFQWTELAKPYQTIVNHLTGD